MKQTNKSWKKEYVDILENGPKEQDSDLARELIDAGFAAGVYDLDDNLKVDFIHWKSVTVKGRLLADKLRDDLYKSSFLYRMLMASFYLAGWVMGVVSAYVNSLFECH